MMPPFPFFRPPMYYNSYRNPYYNNFQNNSANNTNSQVFNGNIYANKQFSQSKGQAQGFPITDNVSHSNANNPSQSMPPQDEQYFDIFGIRLHFDDILILCLLFFLYQEDVNDQLLFIALLLLLLS